MRQRDQTDGQQIPPELERQVSSYWNIAARQRQMQRRTLCKDTKTNPGNLQSYISFAVLRLHCILYICSHFFAFVPIYGRCVLFPGGEIGQGRKPRGTRGARKKAGKLFCWKNHQYFAFVLIWKIQQEHSKDESDLKIGRRGGASSTTIYLLVMRKATMTKLWQNVADDNMDQKEMENKEVICVSKCKYLQTESIKEDLNEPSTNGSKLQLLFGFARLFDK